jgi:selenocysteine lyase/cysteine desulfurase
MAGAFLNATPGEVAFGANMTPLTFHVARALGRAWSERDEVVVTELDHHANIAPWRALAREGGVVVRQARLRPETGELDWRHLTQNHESIVGAAAAVRFLASLAEGAEGRAALQAAFDALHARSQRLVERLWTGLRAIPRVTVYGPPPDRPRTPTVSFTVDGQDAGDVATSLARAGVFVSHGDFYATTIAQRLAPQGFVRAGCACYTTETEVDRLIDGVKELGWG